MIDIDIDLANLRASLKNMSDEDAYQSLELYIYLSRTHNISITEFYRYMWCFIDEGIC